MSRLRTEREGPVAGGHLTRRHAVGMLVGAAAATSIRPARADQQTDAPALRRGISIHHLLNWPDVTDGPDGVDYVWPPFQSERFDIGRSDLAGLRHQGFDFIRLTVDPSIVISSAKERRATLFDIIRVRTSALIGTGFSVVVDLHPVAVNPRYAPEILVAPDHADVFELYVEAAASLATLLGTLSPQSVALELMNEPIIEDKADFPRWQRMLEHLHARARAAAPLLPLVLTGAQWGSLGALSSLDPTPFRGSNVFYTFHFYEPHTFTHQGVPGDDAEFIRELRWPPRAAEAQKVLDHAAIRIAALPAGQQAAKTADTRKLLRDYLGTPSNPDVIGRMFGALRDWARTHAIAPERILLGEFGGGWGGKGYPGVEADALAWKRCVRTAAEQNRFGWAYWAYDTPLRPDVLAALGMTPDASAD